MANDPIHVVILGGGFAGVYTAMYLERAMTRAERVKIQISLVARDNYIVFQPMLPEVIGGQIETLHIISPIRRLAPGARLYTREIEAVDLQQRSVRLAPGFRPKPMILPFDHLVVGVGTLLDHSKVPGSKEHAMPFKYLGDALRLRNQIVHVLEEADIETDPIEKRRLLTFVVGGGGFSGVECVAEINEFTRQAARNYRNIKPSDLRVILLQSADRILPEMKEDLAHFSHRILERRGVEIRLQTRLKAVSANQAVIQKKGSNEVENIPSRTVVTTVPAGPHPLVLSLGFPMERDRIKVDEFLQVPGHDNCWALGDCAAVPQPDGITSPPTAQHATRQAKTLANNLVAAIRGTAKKKFLFTGLGKMGSLGRGCAVAEVFGIKLSGWIAWVLWRTVYLAKFPGFDRQFRISCDWTLDLFLPRDITGVRLFTPEEVAQEHFEPGEIIFEQGDFGDKAYFMAKGTVDIIRDGERIAEVGQGGVFGEIALLQQRQRSATVVAQTPVDVITVNRETFHQLLAHVPGVKQSMEEILRKHLNTHSHLADS